MGLRRFDIALEAGISKKEMKIIDLISGDKMNSEKV